MIDRCFDYRLIKRLADWPPVISQTIIYLVDDGVGLWTFHRYRDGLLIHADMSDECRGARAIESAKAAFAWIFDNTGTNKIYARIPAENKPACYMARWSGMTFIATEDNRRCYEVTP